MPRPDDQPVAPSSAAPAATAHEHISRIDAEIISLVRQRQAAMAELDELRRTGRAQRVELARENAVFRRYESALGRLGTRLAMLLAQRDDAR